MNMKEFNGYYGCLICLDKGIRIGKQNLPTEPHNERTMEMMIKYALAKGISIYGVKGPSVLNIYCETCCYRLHALRVIRCSKTAS